MQRNLDVDLAIFVDSLKVDVQHFVAKRMHLHVPQEHAMRALAELHRQNRGVKRFLLERVNERVVVELDGLRSRASAVHDARRPTRAAQAAARASAFGCAGKCSEFMLHDELPPSAAFRFADPADPVPTVVRCGHTARQRRAGKL